VWYFILSELYRLHLKRVFGPKEEKVISEWRKFHNKELQNSLTLRNFVTTIKSRRMKSAG
jgi:hypothetical protein